MMGKEVYIGEGNTDIITGFDLKIRYLPQIMEQEVYLFDSGDLFCSQVYPILKTAEELTDEVPEMFDGSDPCNEWFQVPHEHRPDQYDMYAATVYHDPEPALLMNLISKGYGAVPDKESPTGYVDFINNLPCVTPKMVEDYLKNNPPMVYNYDYRGPK